MGYEELAKLVKKKGIKKGDGIIVIIKGLGTISHGGKFISLDKGVFVYEDVPAGTDPMDVFNGIRELIEHRINDLKKIDTILKTPKI